MTEQPDADLSAYDRIGLASGIYFNSFAKQIIAFAEAHLPENKDVFYIYTHGAPVGCFLRGIRAVAKKKTAARSESIIATALTPSVRSGRSAVSPKGTRTKRISRKQLFFTINFKDAFHVV